MDTHPLQRERPVLQSSPRLDRDGPGRKYERVGCGMQFSKGKR